MEILGTEDIRLFVNRKYSVGFVDSKKNTAHHQTYPLMQLINCSKHLGGIVFPYQ